MKKKISKILSFPAILFAFGIILFVFAAWKQKDFFGTPVNKYPADVAIAWVKMQNKLLIGTPGILPHVAGRTYAYTGLTLYESIVPGMDGYQSLASQLNGNLKMPAPQMDKKYYWPASANAALAFINKNLLPHTTPALLKAIDSLESDFNNKFKASAGAEELERSADFGKQVATAIFEWSKTDGGHEAYRNPFSDCYVPPIGPGKWVPTDTIFKKPVYPYWGNNRTFIPGIAEATQPPPPPVYSETPGSEFYNAANEVYTMSQKLTREDSLCARFWAYELLKDNDVATYDDVSHAANIATQMIVMKKLSLQDAAVLYCKHGIAGNEAGISCVKTKFRYNVVRPVTYIRTVLRHPNWNPVIFTPPFPEYTSGHAVVSMSYAAVLQNTFGKIPFIDHSFDNSYGARKFESFEAYAKEAALSRMYGGIHYRFGMEEGLKQGKKVAEMANQLKFKK
jgi:hypothetical protein